MYAHDHERIVAEQLELIRKAQTKALVCLDQIKELDKVQLQIKRRRQFEKRAELLRKLETLDRKVTQAIFPMNQQGSPSKNQAPRYFTDLSNKSPKRLNQTRQNQSNHSPTNKHNKINQKENKQQQTFTPQILPKPAQEEPKQPPVAEKEAQIPQKGVEPVLSKSKEQNDYAKLKERFDKLQQQHKKSLQKISTLQGQIAQLQQEKEDLIPRSSKFFEGQVLVGFEDYKEKLTQLIQQNFGATIKRTKLLFRLEKDHPRNLHPFLDGISPFVVIAKNKKEDREYHFACISQGAISQDLKQQKRGWLMSLTNGRTFSVANGKSAVLYDGMYLIFGNQQLRIDGSSSRAFSNFGINNSFYNTTGNDVRDFLGPGLQGTPREADIDSFQIFQVIF